MSIINPGLVPMASVKDSRWLTLEVCREYQRNKCQRNETECKFAHPPGHVEVQNGRVVCCYDSIKGKCQRKDPPCKYLHPPQHLREQLLQNGRNNLIIKNLQMHMLSHSLAAAASGHMVPVNGHLINASMAQPAMTAAAAAAAAHSFPGFFTNGGLHMLPAGMDALIGPPPPPPPPPQGQHVGDSLPNGMNGMNGISISSMSSNAVNGVGSSSAHMVKADNARDCLPGSYHTGKRPPTASGDKGSSSSSSGSSSIALYQPASYQHMAGFHLPTAAQSHTSAAFMPTSFTGHMAALPRY